MPVPHQYLNGSQYFLIKKWILCCPIIFHFFSTIGCAEKSFHCTAQNNRRGISVVPGRWDSSEILHAAAHLGKEAARCVTEQGTTPVSMLPAFPCTLILRSVLDARTSLHLCLSLSSSIFCHSSHMLCFACETMCQAHLSSFPCPCHGHTNAINQMGTVTWTLFFHPHHHVVTPSLYLV